MHELSIVMSIIDLAREELHRAGARQIDSIELDIGALAGIEMDALRFAWKAAIPGTVLEKARPVINELPARARCVDCGCEFEADSLFSDCPDCKGLFTQILSGKEMRVKALTVS